MAKQVLGKGLGALIPAPAAGGAVRPAMPAQLPPPPQPADGREVGAARAEGGSGADDDLRRRLDNAVAAVVDTP